MNKIAMCGAALLAIAVSSTAFATTPDPAMSSGDDRLAVSPANCHVTGANKFVYTYTFRDGTGAPIVGIPASQVLLDFRNCYAPSTRTMSLIPADGPSDANGQMIWSDALEFGGADPCYVFVLFQGNVFHTIPRDGSVPGGVRSPDIDGNGTIELVDLSQWQPAFINNGPAYKGDYTLDDAVGLTDLSVFQAHFIAGPCP